MEHQETRIIVETDRHRISGVLRLPRDGYRSRLTDYLNASERGFLPLTEVEIAPLDGRSEAEQRPYVAVSLAHIVVAMQADPAGSDEDESSDDG